MNITLLYASGPRTVHELDLSVQAPCTLHQALMQSGWLEAFPEVASLMVGIWNRKADPNTLVRDGDRIEVYRKLRVDPKVARRERFQGQGARGTGLFSKRRPNSKAGY